MKRSKALSIIQDFIYELNVDPEGTKEKADKLLTKLEEAGILIPKCYTIETKEFINPPDGFYFHQEGYKFHHIPHSWEPEND